ncbi:MAG: DUF1501 domain-containing protein [Planctomycetes bacterium]|nr:DUF1501 domain-containing protein [Planctomycetota bacterium]
MDRRHFLKHVAAYSALALPGIEFARTIHANAQQLRQANKSVIILWMGGGPASIDIWDLKPGAATGGPFTEIQTTAPGVRISQHMPKVAQQMRHLSIVRSLQTSEGDHNRGRQLMHTSYTPNPAIAFPSIGAVAAHEVPKLANYRDISLPNYISVGGAADGPGFLGMNYAPFTVQNPGTPPENIRAPQSLGQGTDLEDRVRRRQRLFYELEDQFMYGRVPHVGANMAYTSQSERDAKLRERAKFADASKAHRDIYYKGFSLVASKEGKVFDLKDEKKTTLDAYGNNNFGRSAIMARRLVEAGVSAVEINLGGWDTHNQTFDAHSTRLQPTLDNAMGTLVSELAERRMLESTVIVWMGEFGRTPRINQNNGRDHWARSWSVVVGGGLIRGGQAYGATTADGMDVARDKVNIGDVFATIYRGLGIVAPDNLIPQVRDAIGRPFAIAGLGGRPINALFAG